MVNFIFSIENFINEKLLGPPRRWALQLIQERLRWLVILGVLLVSLALGYLNSSTLIMAAIALPIIIAGALALIRWPQLGLIALVGSIAIPINGPSNSNLTMVLAVVLLALWISEMMLRQHRIALMPSYTFPPLFALLLVATASFGFGQLNWYQFAQRAPLGAQLGGLSLYYLSAGVYLVAAHWIDDIRWIRWLVWLFLGLGSAAVFGWIVPGPVGGLLGSILSNQATGSLFWTWLLIHAFSQAALNDELHPRWRIALGLLSLATLYVMVTALWTWNSGWVPPLISVFVIIVFAFPRLGSVGIFMGILGVLVKLSSVIASVMVGDNQYSLATRLEAWIILWNVVKPNPILGLGPANYYWYTPLFPIRGYAVSFNSHQQYVDLLLQVGILGLICFVAFFASVGWMVWRMLPRVSHGFPRAYVYGAMGGVAGTFTAAVFGDWVIPFFYNINLGGFRASMLSWLFFGGVLALKKIMDKNEQPQAEDNDIAAAPPIIGQ
jgi:O-antigen ligase